MEQAQSSLLDLFQQEIERPTVESEWSANALRGLGPAGHIFGRRGPGACEQCGAEHDGKDVYLHWCHICDGIGCEDWFSKHKD